MPINPLPGLKSMSDGSVHRKKCRLAIYGYIWLVMDTKGNMIGLHSM
ncbi:hypothetical protein [Methylomonas sp.]|jgi:predicted enzyme related to lactoylglutathione lyase|nr:hypothetical protein [Methylomonas sp.]